MKRNLASRSRGLVIGTLTASLAVALAACSSPSSGGASGGGTSTHSAKPQTKSASDPKTKRTPKATSALSGKWSGHYSGAYTGTFLLKWHQAGSHLHGTIFISSFNGTVPINGSVQGSSIRFGTVGSTDVTYSGTVSGTSMSGTYKVHTPTGAPGGPWSATKS